VRADSEAEPYKYEGFRKSELDLLSVRVSGLTMMIPPPTPPAFIHPSLKPNIFATQSMTTDSNSVQAGEQSQLKPGFETAPVYISARIDS
jgi:hypothetical protein